MRNRTRWTAAKYFPRRIVRHDGGAHEHVIMACRPIAKFKFFTSAAPGPWVLESDNFRSYKTEHQKLIINRPKMGTTYHWRQGRKLVFVIEHLNGALEIPSSFKYKYQSIIY